MAVNVPSHARLLTVNFVDELLTAMVSELPVPAPVPVPGYQGRVEPGSPREGAKAGFAKFHWRTYAPLLLLLLLLLPSLP